MTVIGMALNTQGFWVSEKMTDEALEAKGAVD